LFGGSASALLILAAWSLLHLRLQREGLAARLVIQRNEVAYRAPVAADAVAVARLAGDADWPRFLRTLQRAGRARITAEAWLHAEPWRGAGAGTPAATFRGEYVALAS